MSTTMSKTKSMVLIALMAAVTCVLAPLSIAIPVSPVPISLTTLVLFFSAYILGMRDCTISYLIYLLLGLAGLPVFSGFTGGAGKLMGPTGGYLIGFIFTCLICGWTFDHSRGRWMDFIGMLAGTAVCYLFGTVWLALQAGLSFKAALGAGVIPFIPGDLAKILIALLVAPEIVKRLRASGALEQR